MEGLSKEVKTQKAIGVVKPLVLMQKGDFREGLKRNWAVSLETGVVVIGASTVQRPEASSFSSSSSSSPSECLLGEELVLEYR